MTYFFTFGSGQVHQNGYHKIEADTKEAAREEMVRKFGTQWSMQYESAEAAGVERWGLHEVK